MSNLWKKAVHETLAIPDEIRNGSDPFSKIGRNENRKKVLRKKNRQSIWTREMEDLHFRRGLFVLYSNA
jgi:hypothetical protein